jgi:hypothetical protein
MSEIELNVMVHYKAAGIALRLLACENSRGILRYRNFVESCRKTPCQIAVFSSLTQACSSVGCHLALGLQHLITQNLCFFLHAVYLLIDCLTS